MVGRMDGRKCRISVIKSLTLLNICLISLLNKDETGL